MLEVEGLDYVNGVEKYWRYRDVGIVKIWTSTLRTVTELQ